MHPVFSSEWAREYGRALNQRASYREAARMWEGAVLLVMTEPGEVEPERGVFMDLWHGDCREARAAGPEDGERARYILTGTAAAWKAVLGGRLPPLMALMTGRLRVTKGLLADLVPFAGAARELVLAATSVPTAFPADED